MRLLELSWYNVDQFENTTILITDTELAANESFIRSQIPINDANKYYVENTDHDQHSALMFATTNNVPILYALSPKQKTGWQTTTVPFDYQLSRNVTADTKCYGYWATMVGSAGQRIAETCVRAYPKWMNEMREHIKSFRLRDLFLVGSHDSGSYRERFDPQRNETRVSKYTLTQVGIFE